MTKKYELVKTDTVKSWDGRTLYRIRALVAIAAFGVSVGDLGGYVEKEENLAQVYGDAWVSGNARVSGDARVSGNAQVYGDAQVSGNAQVYGDAQVYGNAQVYGDAQVSGNAQVYGDAQVYGNAQVYGDARVSPINITALTWNITIADTQMVIGCQAHDLTRWEKFSDRQISAMDPQALGFWKAHKDLLLGLAKANGRPVASEPSR